MMKPALAIIAVSFFAMPAVAALVERSVRMTPTEAFAADELEAWLIRRKADLGGWRIALRQDDSLGADVFRMRIATNRVEVAGGVRGVLYGAYEFLQRFCGIEWFARDTVKCPEGGTIALPETFDFTGRPAFEMRELYFHGPHVDGDFAARLRLNGDFSGVAERHGGKMCPVGAGLRSHTFHRLVPHEVYGDAHPEYFALRNGRRMTKPKKSADFELQLCLSNPDVRTVLEMNFIRAVASDPKGCRFGVFQNDNENYCQCAVCTRIADEEGSQAGPIVRLVNAVAESVKQIRPDILVQTGAYQYSRHPSRTPYADNVLLELCTIERDMTEPMATGSDAENAAIRRDFKGWSKLARHLYVFDYVTDFNAYQMPLPNVDLLQSDMRYYRDCGFRWVTAEGPYHGTGGDLQELKAYLLAKLMWNPDADVAHLTDAFLNAYYGKAAPIVREYLYAERELGQEAGERRMNCFTAPTDASIVTDAFLERASAIWSRAIRAVADEPDAMRRHVRVGSFGVDLIRYYRLYDRLKPTDFSLRRSAMADDAAYADLAALARCLLECLKEEPSIRLCEGWERAELPRRRQMEEAASGAFAARKMIAGADAVEIGSDGLHVEGLDTGASAIVSADGAFGGKAVRLSNTSFDWLVQKEMPVRAFDANVRYRLRVRAKAVKKPEAKADGAAAWTGLTDRKLRKPILKKIFTVAEFGDGWTWLDLGTFEPGEQRFFWFGSGPFDRKSASSNPDIVEILFDRLEISRDDDGNG